MMKMNGRMARGLLGIAVVAAFPNGARAASLILDDFTTGGYRGRLICGSDIAFQSGTMIGGVRNTSFMVPCGDGANPFGQQASLDIARGRPLVVGSGIKVFHRAEVVYGVARGGVFTPLNLDLGGFDRLRVRFDSNDLELNFHVVVYMRDGTARAHAACNVVPGVLPRNVDVRLASDFVPHLGTPDWSDVDAIALIVPSDGSAMGALDYAVTTLSATDEADPGARPCHDPFPSP